MEVALGVAHGRFHDKRAYPWIESGSSSFACRPISRRHPVSPCSAEFWTPQKTLGRVSRLRTSAGGSRSPALLGYRRERFPLATLGLRGCTGRTALLARTLFCSGKLVVLCETGCDQGRDDDAVVLRRREAEGEKLYMKDLTNIFMARRVRGASCVFFCSIPSIPCSPGFC